MITRRGTGRTGYTRGTIRTLVWIEHRAHMEWREETAKLGRSHRGRVLKATMRLELYYKSNRESWSVLSSGVIWLCLHLRKAILMIDCIGKKLECVGREGEGDRRPLELMQVKEGGDGLGYSNGRGSEGKDRHAREIYLGVLIDRTCDRLAVGADREARSIRLLGQ